MPTYCARGPVPQPRVRPASGLSTATALEATHAGHRLAPANNSLQLTRLACGKLERDLPAGMRENEGGVAWAAGQLSSRPLCAARRRNAPSMVMDPISRGSALCLASEGRGHGVLLERDCGRPLLGGPSCSLASRGG
jgi:hypothetical protein